LGLGPGLLWLVSKAGLRFNPSLLEQGLLTAAANLHLIIIKIFEPSLVTVLSSGSQVLEGASRRPCLLALPLSSLLV